jgi:hypothetical protein
MKDLEEGCGPVQMFLRTTDNPRTINFKNFISCDGYSGMNDPFSELLTESNFYIWRDWLLLTYKEVTLHRSFAPIIPLHSCNLLERVRSSIYGLSSL